MNLFPQHRLSGKQIVPGVVFLIFFLPGVAAATLAGDEFIRGYDDSSTRPQIVIWPN